MQVKSSEWERIESVIRWANMTINFFALHIGLPRGENLYQIKRGNNRMSRDVADKIVDAFPAINKLWLIEGIGDMFSAVELTSVSKPFYDLSVEEYIQNIATLEPTDHIILPPMYDCDLAMVYKGRAMGCVTPPNSTLLLKKILPEEIIPGDECVIVTKKIVLLRIVKVDTHTQDERRYRLVAQERETFGDVIVETHQIEAVYKVKGKILINS